MKEIQYGEHQDGYAIVLSTTNDEESRQAIIESLLSEKLAACIQVVPISSYYQWHGEVNCRSRIIDDY